VYVYDAIAKMAGRLRTAGITNFIQLAEDYERLSEEMRQIGPGPARDLEELELEALATRLIAPLDETKLEKLAIWHADHFYRLFNRVEMLDDASFAFLRPVGAAIRKRLLRSGRAVIYLIDNRLPPSRLVAAGPFHGALGFVFASPEQMAMQLAAADGVDIAEADDPRLARFLEEGAAVAAQLSAQVIAEPASLLFVSGECGLDVYQRIGGLLRGTPLIGLFRNEAPDDGSSIQVFNSSDGYRELSSS
jgi:hypothetical protein